MRYKMNRKIRTAIRKYKATRRKNLKRAIEIINSVKSRKRKK